MIDLLPKRPSKSFLIGLRTIQMSTQFIPGICCTNFPLFEKFNDVYTNF